MHLHRDILAGTLFIVIGALALLGARGYPVGSAMRMGPGYFPVVLGWLLVALGALVGLRAAPAGATGIPSPGTGSRSPGSAFRSLPSAS